MKIYMDTDYLAGHLRYGHLEGDISWITGEKEEDFKTLLKKELNDEELTEEEINRLEEYKEVILGNCDIIIDDYEIYDIGDCHWEECLD